MRHSAQKILSKINRQEQERIIAAINSLTNTPRPSGCKKLSGRPAWRIRIGFYRVIYEIQDNKLIVTVVHIGHRREV
ncbi:MAG: type II toxin-antitoxin system RelE/ParE family toxin, partial [Spirochaetes bacterium]